MANLDFENFKHLQNPGHLSLTEPSMIQLFVQMEVFIVNIFLLISVILDHTRLANSRDLLWALSIQLEKISVLMKLQHGSDWGAIGDNTKALFSKCHMIQIFFQRDFLVFFLVDHTRITNSRDLPCALNIPLEISLCVDDVAIGERSGSNQGEIRE